MPPAPNAAAQFKEAKWHMNSGRSAMAAAACEQILKKNPRDAEALILMGMAYLGMGRNADCRRASEKAMALRPRDPRPHHQIASSFLHEGRFADVDRALARGFRECGPHQVLVALQAERLIATADYEAAYQACKPLLDGGVLEPHLVSSAAQACIHTDRRDEGVALLRQCLERDLQPMARSALLFILSETLDFMGRHDEAFIAVKEANDLKNAAPDPAHQSAAIDLYLKGWTREAVGAIPRGAPTELPVFVVGFWRSGTTLVEQTLSSHPQVFGAGELTLLRAFAQERHDPQLPRGEPLILEPAALSRATIDRLSRGYLDHVRRLAPAAARITDKLPPNFMFLGLIQAAFPGAKVIHCVRDPVDTCISCFFNLRGSISYTHDLRALGSFYRDYQRIMAHWKSVLDLPILDVVYEDFVADQEAVARRLIDFIGLPWDEACLRPHENTRVALTRSIHQVRKPVYGTSVARWKRYERHLGPLIEALGDAVGGRGPTP
jgi:tetratricopeptide (TPR) repeat protein